MTMIRWDANGTGREVCHITGEVFHATAKRARKAARLQEGHDGSRRLVERCACGGWHVKGAYGNPEYRRLYKSGRDRESA